MKTLLITKELSGKDLLVDFATAQNIHLLTLPFIRLKKIETAQEHERDILFFGSKNGFDFYRENFELHKDSQLACIGAATKKHIENLGFTVSFTGEKSGDPEAVSQELGAWLAGKRLTFVFSDQSTKSITNALPKSQFDEVVVYQTIAEVQQLNANPSIIVFTSPSNVRSYLLQYEIEPQTQLIAWGKSTRKTLAEQGYEPSYTLNKSTPEELMQYLLTL